MTGDATGRILNRIDQRLTQEKLTFGIHNHYFKGEKFAYESPEDVLNALKGFPLRSAPPPTSATSSPAGTIPSTLCAKLPHD